MSIRYRSDAKVSDRYLIDVDPRVFAIWVRDFSTKPPSIPTIVNNGIFPIVRGIPARAWRVQCKDAVWPVKVKWSHDRLILIMGIPINGKTVFILKWLLSSKLSFFFHVYVLLHQLRVRGHRHTPDIHRHVYAIMVVADAMAPSRHQVISNKPRVTQLWLWFDIETYHTTYMMDSITAIK